MFWVEHPDLAIIAWLFLPVIFAMSIYGIDWLDKNVDWFHNIMIQWGKLTGFDSDL